jgi:hypothetical protein
MITEHTLVTDEQVGTIARPLAHTVLMKHYGPDFCRASTEECLILLETIAFCLRVGASFSDGLRTIVGDGPEMPVTFTPPLELGEMKDSSYWQFSKWG